MQRWLRTRARRIRSNSFFNTSTNPNWAERCPKEEILQSTRSFQFVPEVQSLFEALPEGRYGEQDLVRELNRIIAHRGEVEAMGGLLESSEAA